MGAGMGEGKGSMAFEVRIGKYYPAHIDCEWRGYA